ncbi:MAG TPA: serine/threonine-protein kinase [Acidimicrobiales bacterium]|nr:serine/threonine-protein kinase [Acidimicrobiales bacterium]
MATSSRPAVGDYELERQIGAGASGTVWRARSQGPVARVVALKRLRVGGSAADLERLRREATLLTELDHPHIVRVLEVLHDGEGGGGGGGVALAMQLAPGGSLDDLLAERGRLAPGQVVAVAAPVADALASAHRRGILHGDVKPANVLFTSDGEPLLSDFGVARTLGRRTLTGEDISGTAEYVAPELLDGAHPDPRADIYSLGVVCYQALAGQPPYRGPVPLAVVRAADAGRHLRLESLTHVPEPLAVVVERAMDRDPEQRFASADDFARALRATLPADEIRLPGPAASPGAALGLGGEGDAAAGGSAGATRTFGPRPPRREPEVAPRRWGRRIPASAAVVLAAAGLLFVVRGLVSSDDSDDGGEAIGACPDVEEPVAGPAALVVAGDPEGDGCPTTGVYQPEDVGGTERMILTITIDGDSQRIAIGAPGDQLVLGDWDCDGTDTPGLYRAAAGEVQYFDVWPEVERHRYQPDRTEPVGPGGAASLAEGGGDCDRIEVASSEGV